jgi:hypothetical protein
MFSQHCQAAVNLNPSDSFNSCQDLMTALTCGGSDASCKRSEAAGLLNQVSGCTESGGGGGGGGPSPSPNPSPNPSPSPSPRPSPKPCSPGYWKNHEAEFSKYCQAALDYDPSDSFTTCQELMNALTCKGSDASCKRSLAAYLLNQVSGCTEGTTE